MRITGDLRWAQPRLKPESLGLEPWASGCDKKPLSGIPGGLRAAPRTVRAQRSPSGVLLKCHPAAVGLGCGPRVCICHQVFGDATWSRLVEQVPRPGSKAVCVCACGCGCARVCVYIPKQQHLAFYFAFIPSIFELFFVCFWGEGVEGTTGLNATNTTQTSRWTRSVRDSKLLPARS